MKTQHMMNTYQSTVSALLLALTLFTAGCKQPEATTPTGEKYGITSLSATFPGDDSSENLFAAEIDHEKGTIAVVFPYNYPRNTYQVLPQSALSKVKVAAELDNNATIAPALGIMDLTKEQTLTVTNAFNEKKQYTIIGVIRKSSEAEIKEFAITEPALTGIIDAGTKTITLIHSGNIGKAKATVTVSHGATLSPDPNTTPIDFDSDPEITVTAQNGVDKTVYKVTKCLPKKVKAGIRQGSAKLLWTKKLKDDLGINVFDLTGGIAYSGGKLILNTRNQPSLILNARTGDKEGAIETMATITGGVTNFYTTSDDSGHILICNLSPNAGTFKIWMLKNSTDTPRLLIDWGGSGTNKLGRKFSVIGDITKDAVITAPVYESDCKFQRWQIKDGRLLSTTPTEVMVSAVTSQWRFNCDIIASDPTNPTSDYFVAAYSFTDPVKLLWIDGATHAIKAAGPVIGKPNIIVNAVDCTMFNGKRYVTTSSITSGALSETQDDIVYLHDATTVDGFTGPIWRSDAGKYGGKDNTQNNANGTGDVLLQPSEDGYYLYLFFMFTNGQVGCVQFDCIDL